MMHYQASEVARILLHDLDTPAAATAYAEMIVRNATANGHSDMAAKYADAIRILNRHATGA